MSDFFSIGWVLVYIAIATILGLAWLASPCC